MLANVPVYLWWATSSASVHSSIVHAHTFVHTYVGVFTIMHTYVGPTYMHIEKALCDTFLKFHYRHDYYAIPAVTGIYTNILLFSAGTIDTYIYSTAHTSTLSCFLPHIHLSCSHIHFPPLPYQPRGEQYSSLDGLI